MVDVDGCNESSSTELLRTFADLADPEIQLVTGPCKPGSIAAEDRWRGEIASEIAGSFGVPRDQIAEKVVRCRECHHQNIDLLVSDDSQFHEMPGFVNRNHRVVTPEAACAIIGLYMRLCGDYTVKVERDGKHRHRWERTHFFSVATPALLPPSNEWHQKAVAAEICNPELAGLADAVLLRMNRSLRARDRLHEQYFSAQCRDSADETLFYLDVALFMTLGALDAMARVAHVVAGLPADDIRYAAWHNDRWARDMGKTFPEIDLPWILRHARPIAKLRNAVHGRALSHVFIHDGPEDDAQRHLWAKVPEDVAQCVLPLVADLDADLGVVRTVSGDPYLYPAQTVDAVIWTAGRLLSHLMQGIDPLRLRYAAYALDIPATRPAGATTHNVRLLLGL